MPPSIVLITPEIPQNVASVIRTCACFDLELHIVGPLSFVWDLSKLKRVAMDYLHKARYKLHENFDVFLQDFKGPLVGTSPRGSLSYTSLNDSCGVMFGPESSGLEGKALEKSSHLVTIPMVRGVRSLNLAVSVGIVAAYLFQKTLS